jgi:hypothetical protein
MGVAPGAYGQRVSATVQLVGVPVEDLEPGAPRCWCVWVGGQWRHYVQMCGVDGLSEGFWYAGLCEDFPHHERRR